MTSRPLWFVALALACKPTAPNPDGDDTDTPFTSTQSDTEDSDTDATPTEPAAEGCGPCGSIADGDLTPAGTPKLDGFIVATAQLRDAITTDQASFAADIRALADTYSLQQTEVDTGAVDTLVAQIEADLAAHVEALHILHVPSQCSANLEVAALALQTCERDGGCGPAPSETPPPVKCEGTCLGDCDGSCEGELSCRIAAPGVACEGVCAGTCTLAVPAPCNGNCHGSCEGQCLERDSNGDCIGACDGNCIGTCAPTQPSACDGNCDGACLIDQGSAQCFGEVTCNGNCVSTCTGACQGAATPSTTAKDCPATADCEQQAAAQGSATLRCSPPTLDLQFVFQPGIDATARSQFVDRMARLQRHGTAILQSTAHLHALVEGDDFTPPLVQLPASLQAMISAGIPDTFKIPEGRLPCIVPALQEALHLLGETAVSAAGTRQAQDVFAAFLAESG